MTNINGCPIEGWYFTGSVNITYGAHDISFAHKDGWTGKAIVDDKAFLVFKLNNKIEDIWQYIYEFSSPQGDVQFLVDRRLPKT
jgi:hypothetical protein